MRGGALLATTLVVLAAASAGIVTVGAPHAAAAAPVKSVGVPLPVGDFRAIEFDEGRGRLYVAQGAGSGLPLVVTDLNGRLLERVEAVTDVSDLELSDDGSTLLVVQDFSRVAALDPETLRVTGSYPAPEGVCPFTVESTGGKVVAGYLNCGVGSGGLAVWSAPDTAPVLYTQTVHYIPVLDASPGAPGVLVAGDTAGRRSRPTSLTCPVPRP